MDNIPQLDIGKRDRYLEQIRHQLAEKEKLLRSKEKELAKKGQDNEHLKLVYEEYKSYLNNFETEKEKLIIAMEKIIQHLDDIRNNNKLTKEDLNDIREEENVIKKTINKLRKE
jgi:hypothetical protein